ncbi:MAG: hypothetical protein U5K69_10360 [Balneolaceae bacterium]|nr:hypothetical protein [Balneolaceae bacterium]
MCVATRRRRNSVNDIAPIIANAFLEKFGGDSVDEIAETRPNIYGEYISRNRVLVWPQKVQADI